MLDVHLAFQSSWHVRLSRHAKNEMRLYGFTLEDVEATVSDPVSKDVDERGNARLVGETVDGSAYPCRCCEG